MPLQALRCVILVFPRPRVRETVIRKNTAKNFRMVGGLFFQRELARYAQLTKLGLYRDCLVFSVRSGHDVIDIAVMSQYGGTSRKSCVFVVGELTKCAVGEKWRARQTVYHCI